MIKQIIGLFFISVLVGCGASDGTRCNPLQYSDTPNQGDCDTGYSCVYPTAPNCGVAYCCKVDATGKIIDPHETCQPNAEAAAICMVDLGQPVDGGATD